MNAVIYARYSSHAQNEQSIDGQLRICHEYAERQGLTVVGEYIDRALTGRSDDRPDFQRMISDAKKRAFERVIVYKLDRFARNRYDSAIYKYKLKQYGVKVLSAMEQIGDNPESIILEAVLEASAEYYSVELSQKIKRGRRDSAAKGKFVGGSVPLGYKSISGNLVIDDAYADIVRDIFAKYASGVPKSDIIKDLNERGIKNRHGQPFAPNALQNMFKSKKYIGMLSQGGVEVDGACPALVDPDIFAQAQERIIMNKRCAAKNKTTVDYLLTGKLYCGMCGAPMTGLSGRGRHGDQFYYYACSTRRTARTCKKAHEKKDFLEWYVVEQTLQYVLTAQRINDIADAVVTQYDNEFNDTRIKELEHRIAKLDRDIEKLVDSLIDAPKVAHKRIYERIEAADASKADLEVDLSKLRIANGIRFTADEIKTWLRQFCSGDIMDTAFRERIIDVFINSVYLYDDRVVIWYNIKGGKQISYIETLEAAGATDELEDTELEEYGGLHSECIAPPKQRKIRILKAGFGFCVSCFVF